MSLPPLILASASPRRTELLRQLGLPFRVVPSDAPELHEHHLTARELAQLNAYRKARSVAQEFPESLVLGADTLVCLGSKLFGKPQDLDHARQMLAELQAATHQVVTGVCLIHGQSRRRRLFAECTDVRFKPLTPALIDGYLAATDPLDKAGAYAIQESGDWIVEEISGSYSNVVGLPMERLASELKRWQASA
jgi:septum formation protein